MGDKRRWLLLSLSNKHYPKAKAPAKKKIKEIPPPSREEPEPVEEEKPKKKPSEITEDIRKRLVIERKNEM